MDLINEGVRRVLNRSPRKPLRLVVGLNRVDEIVSGGWDTRLNLPTEAAIREIERRCQDSARLLAKVTDIDRGHIEYYSALKRYRLHDLLNRVIRHCYAGFKFHDVQPLHSEDVDGVDPEAREFTKRERAARLHRRGHDASARDKLFAELSRILNPSDLRLVEDKFATELRRPPRLAVLGQSGVGKTTTVNALFATKWRTSAVEVGTEHPQQKRVTLPSGGVIDVVDLPGYGRSIREDAEYERRYRELIPSCDLVLLIIQADRGDLADDQEMILKLKQWAYGAPSGALTGER
jgi:predicted GTPase